MFFSIVLGASLVAVIVVGIVTAKREQSRQEWRRQCRVNHLTH